MFEKLSPYLGIAKAIAIVALLVGIFSYGFHTGSDHVQAKWNKEKLAAEQQAEKDRVTKQDSINKKATKFAEKAAKERVVTRTIIKEVEKYVPNSLPMLPGDFRLYHDAAATGQEIDDSRRADAAAVSPKDVAGTIAENYASCRYDQERLATLQEIVKTINEGEQ